MNKFYVYRWIRLDTNTPFYVGKGSGTRASNKCDRNKYFKSIIKSVPCRYEIFISGLSEERAFLKEIEFITLYKKFGYCKANITDGGEGGLGLCGDKNPMYGRCGELHPNFGKSLSAERCEALKQRMIGNIPVTRKAIICIDTGIEFASITQASIDLKIPKTSIDKVLSGIISKAGGMKFKYKNKEPPIFISTRVRRIIVCVETQEEFSNADEVAMRFNRTKFNLFSHLNGNKPYKFANHTFKYKE